MYTVMVSFTHTEFGPITRQNYASNVSALAAIAAAANALVVFNEDNFKVVRVEIIPA
jgi:hypothetical protein